MADSSEAMNAGVGGDLRGKHLYAAGASMGGRVERMVPLCYGGPRMGNSLTIYVLVRLPRHALLFATIFNLFQLSAVGP
jgi:hypothetical protein